VKRSFIHDLGGRPAAFVGYAEAELKSGRLSQCGQKAPYRNQRQ
jgi:hypothetical protein